MSDNTEKAKVGHSAADKSADGSLAARLAKLQALLSCAEPTKPDAALLEERQLIISARRAETSDENAAADRAARRYKSHMLAPFTSSEEDAAERAKNKIENIHAGHRKRLREAVGRAKTLNAFNDVQILELLLSFGVPRRDTNPIAHAALDRFGSLFGVFGASYEELVAVAGVTEGAARLIVEMSKVCRWDDKIELCLDKKKPTIDFLHAACDLLEKDEILALYLDDRHRVLAAEVLPVNDGDFARGVVATSCGVENTCYVALGKNGYFPEPIEVVREFHTALKALRRLGITPLDVLIFIEFGYYALSDIRKEGEPDYMFVCYKEYADSPELVYKLLTKREDGGINDEER